MSSDIKNVIVIGAAGNIGPHIVSELLAAGFIVSALTRTTSKSTFPPGITVHKTDYTEKSLLAAFRGQDAIVSAIATYRTTQQKTIIDAAVKTGIKRFLPSEYGVDTSRPEIKDYLPPALTKREIVQYLQTKESSGLSWTAICVGAWFDWPLELGIMGFNPSTCSATVFDSGDQPYEATNVRQVAKAITASLANPGVTANQYVYVNSFTLTQNRVLAALQEASGEKWNVTYSKAKDLGESSLIRMREAEKSGKILGDGEYPDGVLELITAAIYGFRPEGTASLNDFEGRARVWMDRLGLQEENLEDTVREVLGKIEARA